MRYQDLKQTPQKRSSHKKSLLDQSFPKQLLCPFIEALTVTGAHSSLTPIRKQPQYLLSPSPIKKDLFAQLLGSDTKHTSTPVQIKNQINQYQNIYVPEYSSQSNQCMEEQSNQENSANWSDENGIKKRKRKSTVQIKLLKQQLDGQMNWTKQKIIKMAEITGLSQSQVYKWCWDQKKKQIKEHNDNYKITNEKKRNNKKNCISYQNHPHMTSQENDNQFNFELGNNKVMTKMKNGPIFINDCKETQKRVNKKLVFF